MNATATLKTPKHAVNVEVLATMPGGLAIVQIAGTVYTFEPHRSGFHVMKQNEKGGGCYEVVCGGGKAHCCDCDAGKWGYSTCRHVLAANKILESF